MIPQDFYDQPEPGHPCHGGVGDRCSAGYFIGHAVDAGRMIQETGQAIVDLQPGNGTAYRLVVAHVPPEADTYKLAMLGCPDPLAVVWHDTGKGHVFRADLADLLHEKYVAEKLACGLSDAWVIGRFLTALRVKLLTLAALDAEASA